MDDPTLLSIGEKYSKSVAQVILRWHLQNDVIIIPKSSKPARLKENADIFDFALSTEEMTRISQLNKNERVGPDPDNFSF
jgi:methylglyoxal/glyoxal reductase